MESLYTGKPAHDLPSLKVLRPPSALKPPKHFIKILSEYREWMGYNMGKGSKSFARYTLGEEDENSSWAIRQSITERQKRSFHVSASDALRWHLILHLAREHEESITEAEDLLASISSRPGPLTEALYENAPTGENCSDNIETNYSMDEGLLDQVIEAWFGLFSSHLEDESMLMTVDKRITEHLASHFGYTPEGLNPRENGPYSETSITFPQIETDGKSPRYRVRLALSGKTVIYLAKPS